MTKVLNRGLRPGNPAPSPRNISRVAVALAFSAGLSFLAAVPANAAPYGVNLIVNGTAEQGASSLTGDPLPGPIPVPGWTTSSAFTVVPYGAAGGFPTASDPGPPDRSTQFFAGGKATTSTATQDIDVSANAADINSGKVTLDLSGWMGGFGADPDFAQLVVTYLNSGSTTVGSMTIGPVNPSDRNNTTALLLRTKSVTVPQTTVKLRVTLTMTRTSGAFNDGYADSLSLILRAPTVVTTTADSGPGSLRAALAIGNVITFDPAVFGAANAPHVIELSAALPVIQNGVTITGPGSDLLTIHQTTSGQGVFRLFFDRYSGSAPLVTIQSLTVVGGSGASVITTNTCDLTLKNAVVRGGIVGVEAYYCTIGVLNCLIADGNTGLVLYDATGNLVAATISNCRSTGTASALDVESGMVTATSSTFSGNMVSGTSSSLTGTLYAYFSTVTLNNCTVSGNQTQQTSGASTIRVVASNLLLSNCTVANNTTYSSVGANAGSSVELSNSIIFDSGLSFSMGGGGASSIKTDGYNLSGDNGGGFLNKTGDRPNTSAASLNLGPLQNNGGPTFTHALLPGSIAIDKGNTALVTDQRGAPRAFDDPNSPNIGGNNSDIGAFEFQGVPLVVLANISSRLPVGTNDNALFAGFYVRGYQPKKVLLRAIGPSLSIPGKLTNPTLELYDTSGTLLQANDNWKDSPNKQAIIDSGAAPTQDLEAAIIAYLPASPSGTSYTAIVRGAGNSTGIGVVEAYDLDRSLDSKLVNISSRGFVQTGDDVLFAGNIVVGQVGQKVLIRALGPSVPVAGNMANPTLELHDGNGALMEANDNWVDSPNMQAIIDSTIPPSSNLESAIIRTLPPGTYTAIVRSANNTPGIAVVEIYALQ